MLDIEGFNNKLEKLHKSRFNNLTLNDLPEPELIPNMKRAAQRIIEVLNKKKKLLIIGDYDTDGIMATIILTSFFKETIYKDRVSFIIPDRFKDGYGVSKNLIDYAIKENIDLIVTVDNGIGAGNSIKYATDNNIEVIVTDHHIPTESVPDIDIIVDLKLDCGEFPYQDISGATISWYLCSQIREELDLPIDMRKYIDLVGITVISDIMPLRGINLVFYYEGMNRIRNGQREIYKYIFKDYELKTLSEQDIGFKLVPMINAVGRIDKSKNVVDIFLSNELSKIKEGAKYLFNINKKRKAINNELIELILPEAINQSKNNEVIIIKRKDLHEGIVGVLAGKLSERFKKPSYVFTWNKIKKCWKGSGRTYGNINLHKLTLKAKDFVIGFGGHVGAVGVAIDKDNFSNWEKRIRDSAKLINKKEFLNKEDQLIDLDLNFIDNQLINTIKRYEPYGEGFKRPLYRTKCFITKIENYQNGLHWKTKIRDKKGNEFIAWFFHEKRLEDIKEEDYIDINYQPKMGFSYGNSNIEILATLPI